MHQPNQRKRRLMHNVYVDIDGVTEQPGPNYNNWIEITKRKLQVRESKLLKVIKHKIESIVNETLNVDASSPRSFTISVGIMKHTWFVLTNNINQWTGVNLSRLKKPPALYRDYFNVSKKSWDRRKTKLFGSALWVNVFKQIHQFVWMNMRTLIQMLQALFCATIKYTNTKAQSLITGTMICESKEFQNYFISLDDSFRIPEWITAMDKKHRAKSLQEKMQFHLNYILTQSVVNTQMNDCDSNTPNNERHYYEHTHTQRINGGGRGRGGMQQMEDYDSKEANNEFERHYYEQTAVPLQPPQPPQPHPQPQQQNFIFNRPVVSEGGARLDASIQHMDVDGNNGRFYNVNAHRPPPPQPQPQALPPITYHSNYYSNQYPPEVRNHFAIYPDNTTSNASGHCCCCSCNHGVERFMNVTNGNCNYNNANQSSANGNAFQEFGSQSLSNSPYAYDTSTSLNSNTDHTPPMNMNSNSNTDHTTTSTSYGFNTSTLTPPNIYTNETIDDNGIFFNQLSN